MTIPDFGSLLNHVGTWWHGLDWIEKGAIATAGAITSLYGASKTVFSVYRWCLAKYDGKILGLLEEALRRARLTGPNITVGASSLADVSAAAERSEESAYRSLRRLEKQGKVKESKDGWVLADPNANMVPARFNSRFNSRF